MVKMMKNGDFPTTEKADREIWVELLGSNPTEKTLQFVGISPSTWKKICAGKNPELPTACGRLARFVRYGQLEDIAGPEWSEFSMESGKLRFPGVKYPFSASELKSTWLRLNEAAALRSKVAFLTADLAEAEKVAAEAVAAAEKAQRHADYYRRQLCLESKAGMMLASIVE